MKNVTVTLDARTARWARIEAARRDISVSSLVRELLEQRMSGQESYAESRRRYLARSPAQLKHSGSYPTRDEIHDRASLR
jgi:hypothetical protein